MRNRWNTMQTALATLMLVATAHLARASTDGLVLRAAGFFQAESSGDGGTCTVPGVATGIAYSSDTIGLWNTFGIPTIQYPQTICDGWLQLQNNMVIQGVSIQDVDIRLRIPGANRYRQYVPTRSGWPTACKGLRHTKVYSGAYLFPVNSDNGNGNTGSGAPNIVFVNLFPIVSAQVITCLREQYGPLDTDVLASLPVVVRAVATGISDNGTTYKSNPNQLTGTPVCFETSAKNAFIGPPPAAHRTGALHSRSRSTLVPPGAVRSSRPVSVSSRRHLPARPSTWGTNTAPEPPGSVDWESSPRPGPSCHAETS